MPSRRSASKRGRGIQSSSLSDREILPGIRVFIGGRHTWASQYVAVTGKPGPIVLASDNMYLYENLEKLKKEDVPPEELQKVKGA